jgi:hypothetical protein
MSRKSQSKFSFLLFHWECLKKFGVNTTHFMAMWALLRVRMPPERENFTDALIVLWLAD